MTSTNAKWQLAQLNCAIPLYEKNDPRFAGFVDHLDEINGLGDSQPGWIWRLQDDAGDAMAMSLAEAPGMLFNVTVWEDVASLHAFVYRTKHAQFFKRRAEWFVHSEQPTTVLWWVLAGHRPDISEAWARLQILRSDGPTDQAFTFQKRFDPPA